MKLKRAGKDAAPADGAEAPLKAPKTNHLVPAVVLAVGLLGGGFFMGGRSGDAAIAAAPAPSPADHAPEESGHGPVQELEPITLNLADGRFLKVGIALQTAEAGGESEEGGEELPGAKALDIAIDLLGSHTMDELASPKEREVVKKELSKRVAEAYADPVTAEPMVTKVYFTEFVMQ